MVLLCAMHHWRVHLGAGWLPGKARSTRSMQPAHRGTGPEVRAAAPSPDDGRYHSTRDYRGQVRTMSPSAR